MRFDDGEHPWHRGIDLGVARLDGVECRHGSGVAVVVERVDGRRLSRKELAASSSLQQHPICRYVPILSSRSVILLRGLPMGDRWAED